MFTLAALASTSAFATAFAACTAVNNDAYLGCLATLPSPDSSDDLDLFADVLTDPSI